jgi:hypothetical protein
MLPVLEVLRDARRLWPNRRSDLVLERRGKHVAYVLMLTASKRMKEEEKRDLRRWLDHQHLLALRSVQRGDHFVSQYPEERASLTTP